MSQTNFIFGNFILFSFYLPISIYFHIFHNALPPSDSNINSNCNLNNNDSNDFNNLLKKIINFLEKLLKNPFILSLLSTFTILIILYFLRNQNNTINSIEIFKEPFILSFLIELKNSIPSDNYELIVKFNEISSMFGIGLNDFIFNSNVSDGLESNIILTELNSLTLCEIEKYLKIINYRASVSETGKIFRQFIGFRSFNYKVDFVDLLSDYHNQIRTFEEIFESHYVEHLEFDQLMIILDPFTPQIYSNTILPEKPTIPKIFQDPSLQSIFIKDCQNIWKIYLFELYAYKPNYIIDPKYHLFSTLDKLEYLKSDLVQCSKNLDKYSMNISFVISKFMNYHYMVLLHNNK